MTEAEWKSAPITDLMLHTLDIHRARHGVEPSKSVLLQPPHAILRCDLGRKHMLLGFAVVRRYWSRIPPEAQRTIVAWEAVEEGEREADLLGDDFIEFMDSLIECYQSAEGEAALALWLVFGWWQGVKTELPGQEFPASWRPLFDDVFGDAFWSLTLDPAWRTDAVESLARQIYESRDFSPMPILADALRDAGCAEAHLLDHCSSPGPHVRGCWAVDLLLGKD